MNKSSRKMLENFALKSLRDSADDGWSYICVNDAFGFFPWDECEDAGIERGDFAAARACAESGEWTSVHIVPIKLTDSVEGVALFLVNAGAAPEDEPMLAGVFESVDLAKSHLRAAGVIAGDT